MDQAVYQDCLARLEGGLRILPDKPEETPESTLRALWHAAAGVPKSAELALAEALPELDGAAVDRLRVLLQQRLDGIPLAHLSGRQRYLGLEMLAGPEALVPRKETEILGVAAVSLAQELSRQRDGILVVDVCTGSGNVALAVAERVPGARVFGADLCEPAVGLARRNAQHLGLDGRVEFRAGDLLAPFESADFLGQVDLLTCNPPYINSVKVESMVEEISRHEPKEAFDGGPFGVAILMRIFQEAPRFLRSGGWLAVEVGLGQGPSLVKRLERQKLFRDVQIRSDAEGAVRVILVHA